MKLVSSPVCMTTLRAVDIGDGEYQLTLPRRSCRNLRNSGDASTARHNFESKSTSADERTYSAQDAGHEMRQTSLRALPVRSAVQGDGSGRPISHSVLSLMGLAGRS